MPACYGAHPAEIVLCLRAGVQKNPVSLASVWSGDSVLLSCDGEQWEQDCRLQIPLKFLVLTKFQQIFLNSMFLHLPLALRTTLRDFRRLEWGQVFVVVVVFYFITFTNFTEEWVCGTPHTVMPEEEKASRFWTTFYCHGSQRPPYKMRITLCMLSCSVMSEFLRPYNLQPTQLLCPWNFPGKNTALAGRFFTIAPYENLTLLIKSKENVICIHKRRLMQTPKASLQTVVHSRSGNENLLGLGNFGACEFLWLSYLWHTSLQFCLMCSLFSTLPCFFSSFYIGRGLLLLSRFSCVQLSATPQMAAHQAPLSLGVSRQEHWSGVPFPSRMHEG